MAARCCRVGGNTVIGAPAEAACTTQSLQIASGVDGEESERQTARPQSQQASMWERVGGVSATSQTRSQIRRVSGMAGSVAQRQ
jgi:hypothetical protein